MPSPITQKQFHIIARDIRESSKINKYSAAKIAKHFNVSISTVSAIRRAKTWNGFLAQKSARQTSPKTSPVEQELATSLAQLEQAPTRDEFDSTIKQISERQGGLLHRVRAIEADRTDRRLYIASIAISAVALLLAIIALVK